MASKADQVIRAYARLSALRKNAPDSVVSEELVNDYHEALSHLEAVGYDVSELRIPGDRLEPRWAGGRSTGENVYTKGKYISQRDFLTRLDAVLTYFEISQPGQAVVGDQGL